MAKKLKKRKILNQIREVSVYDFADDPRRKKAPKNAKYLKNFKGFSIT